MKVLVIGGVTGTEQRRFSNSSEELLLLGKTMRVLGALIAGCWHEIVVCSPFSDSADYHILQGIAEFVKESTAAHPVVSIHYPAIPTVEAEVKSLFTSLNMLNLHRFPCTPLGSPRNQEDLQNAWLFAQLNALDVSAGVIAVGGRPSGSLNLLFHLADARKKRVLPLTFLGGAAQVHYDAKYWELKDLLHNDIEVLDDPSSIDRIPTLMETMLAGPHRGEEQTFFISYARARPNEADYIETLLRRRDHIVYRDEEEFEPSAETQGDIIRSVQRASVFVALWCKEYACSPWCNDELEIALARHQKGHADLWIFCIDDTRIVPKAARGLNYYHVKSREELEGKMLFLLGKLLERKTDI